MIIEPHDSETVLPGVIDLLFYEVMQLRPRLAPDAPVRLPLKRQRHYTQDSITLDNLCPNLMLLVNDMLLFKGQEKTSGDLREAKTELVEKMSDWSAAYHGMVEYMLCYAAAGGRLVFCALQRSGPGQPSDLVEVLPELDLRNAFDRLRVMHTALLTYNIVSKQYEQLPRGLNLKPFGLQVHRDRGCSIQYFINYIVKRVQLCKTPLLQPIADKMEGIYAATSSCDYLIKASQVCVTEDWQYIVQLSPVATSMSGPPQSEQELAAAVRCILCALQCLHSNGWGHGDLRWANVVVEHAGKYRVIDLESVVLLGSKPQLEAKPKAWGAEAAALEEGVFTAHSDLYMVGQMMQQAMVLGGGTTLAAKLVGKQLTLDEALGDH